MRYKGSCHCGDVAYAVEGEISAVVSCNCSICSRKGALLMAAPRDSLTVYRGEEKLARYTFNKHKIVHRFCTTCGIHTFAEHATAEDGGSIYVNVRCLEEVDPSAVNVIQFDGRSL